MRYNVGERIPFVSVFFDEVIDYGEKRILRSETGVQAYLPWEHTNLKVIVEPMICVSHHRVSGEWDDEIKHDGYIFHGNEQSVWHNQYPNASYGQLDDSLDRQVLPAELTDDILWLRREDGRVYLKKILRGVQLFAGRDMIFQGKGEANIEYLQSLFRFYKEIRVLIEKELEGKVLIHQPVIFKLLDGTQNVHENIRDVVIHDDNDPNLFSLLQQQQDWEDNLVKECMSKMAKKKAEEAQKKPESIHIHVNRSSNKSKSPVAIKKQEMKQPPRDGSTITVLRQGKLDTEKANYDANWGGRGSWFTEKGQAFKEETIVSWN